MAVLTQQIGRRDIELQRGVVCSIGAEWRERVRGEPDRAVDISGEDAYFRMFSESGELLYEQKCETNDIGCAYCRIPDNAFVDDEWKLQLTGNWKIIVNHNEQKTLLGWGNYLLV